ncbi:amidohydrolase family protein, partial [Actinomadura adrarensis]
GADPSKLFGELEPIRAEYRDRDARLAVMDEQGMEACIMLPTLGVGMEIALSKDIPALAAAFRAFNRWLEEDWGFAYKNRIFAAPYITLADPDNAVRELEWALERDARFIVMIPGPVLTEVGMRAPADPMFDAFWQLVNDSGITVTYHGGETHYTKFLTEWGEKDFTEAFRATAFRGLASPDPMQDTLASHLSLGLFHRFPNLRMASIEVGSAWVFHLFEKLSKSYGQVPHLYPEDPRETFKRHVWVSPFYEDELASLLELVGAEHILMGSDYPHVEGLADPASYIKDLENFDYTPEQCETVMRRNGWELATRRPA